MGGEETREIVCAPECERENRAGVAQAKGVDDLVHLHYDSLFQLCLAAAL